jgi:hypothetical protein
MPTLPHTRALRIEVTGHDHPGLTHSLPRSAALSRGVGLKIDRIDRLSGRTPLANDGAGRVCVELSASSDLASEDEMRSALMA